MQLTLVADSGSTKTDWRGFNGAETVTFKTRGFNPYFFSSQEIVECLKTEVPDRFPPGDVKRIFFYGAGCSTREKCLVIEKALHEFFPNAEVAIHHDLLGAARATLGKKQGIACILGTGSNSCRYDGEKIIDNIPALGYVLGDQGSASWLGKKLVAAYFNRELPAELEKAMSSGFDMDRGKVLESVYHLPHPNLYLAGFAPVLSRYPESEFSRSLLREAFEGFIRHHVLKYRPARGESIHFVGSIAFSYRDILSETLAAQGLSAGLVIQTPVERLAAFHGGMTVK